MSDEKEDEEFITRVGPLKVDWPRSIGYFGGIGVAVALDLIAPPLALFVAVVPLLKLLKRREAPRIERAIGAVLEGMAKPIGGDAESTVRLADADGDEAEDDAPAQHAPAPTTAMAPPAHGEREAAPRPIEAERHEGRERHAP
ncbi:MAG: hypothetical protein QM820_40095 [Minicystis sp.]